MELRIPGINKGIAIKKYSAGMKKLIAGDDNTDGKMIAYEKEKEGVIFADVSKDKVLRYRNDSALLSARRDDIYSLRIHRN